MAYQPVLPILAKNLTSPGDVREAFVPKPDPVMVICVSVPAEAPAGVTEVIAGDEVSARYVGGFENSEGYISTGIPCSVFVIPSFIRCASVAGDDDC
jgi:hypothetical protein